MSKKSSSVIQMRRVETERSVYLSDWHVPYHDKTAIELVFNFLRWFKPHTIFLVGDFLDFYQISRFSKDPERLLELQQDLNIAKGILRRIRKDHQKARIVYMDGNHEHRLTTYLWQHPEISTLDKLKLPELLELPESKIEHHNYHEQLKWYGLLVEHGDRVSKHSAYTAKSMVEARGVSGISGHSHRLATHFRYDNSGMKLWAENGCLCELNPSYVIGVPNWMQGFTVAQAVRKSDRFFIEQIPIIKHKIFYSGLLWDKK